MNEKPGDGLKRLPSGKLRGRKSIYDDRKHQLAAARFRRFYERNKLSLKVKRKLAKEKAEKEFQEFLELARS